MGPIGDDRGADIRKRVARWEPDGPNFISGGNGEEGPEAASREPEHKTLKAYVLSLHGQDLPKPRVGTRRVGEADAAVIATPFEGDPAVAALENLLQPEVVKFFRGLNYDDMPDELIMFLDGKTQAIAQSAAVAIYTWSYVDQEGNTKSESPHDRIALSVRDALVITLLDGCPEHLRAEAERYAGRIARACSKALEPKSRESGTIIYKPLPAEFDRELS